MGGTSQLTRQCRKYPRGYSDTKTSNNRPANQAKVHVADFWGCSCIAPFPLVPIVYQSRAKFSAE